MTISTPSSAFSTEACRDQFAVASDPKAVTIKAYDAGVAANPARADRISYVVGQDGKVKFALVSSDPLAHVEQTKAAVRQFQGNNGPTRPDPPSLRQPVPDLAAEGPVERL
jgi:peroxiredoxin